MSSLAAASAGFGANTHWESDTSLNGQFAFSDATRSNRTGRQINLGVQQRLSRAWSLNASLLDRNEGFTDLLESAHAGPSTASRTDTSWSLGATLSATMAGTFGVAYSRTTTFDRVDSARGTLSWGKQIHGVSLSANAEWDLDDNATGNDDSPCRWEASAAARSATTIATIAIAGPHVSKMRRRTPCAIA